MPEAARERVFERFHRELGTGVEGSGLGLAIVAEALQQHGGRIVLDASPALGGLRATVTLPAV
ncbi:MAG: sensor histidine kinase [Xanthomonadales bacterium]|nr:sensor histidine kinase [Xanthomonadales bacterium]